MICSLSMDEETGVNQQLQMQWEGRSLLTSSSSLNCHQTDSNHLWTNQTAPSHLVRQVYVRIYKQNCPEFWGDTHLLFFFILSFFHSWTNQPISDALIIKLYLPFQYTCIYTCGCFCWLHIWRILIVSSRSSRSHSMERRLFLSSLVVQSISSLEAPPPSAISSLHLWWRLWAALTAFCTSLKNNKKTTTKTKQVKLSFRGTLIAQTRNRTRSICCRVFSCDVW